MSERTRYESHLALLRQDVYSLRKTLEGRVEVMRETIDPLKKVEDLDAHLIAQQALEFAGKHSVLLEKLAEIKKAEEILGINGDRP